MALKFNNSSCFIIAEAGVNHNGDVALGKKLIKAAQEAGADAVKFQTWKTENVIVPGTQKAEYQKVADGTEEDQFAMIKKLELSYEDFLKLNTYAAQIGILLFSTPDDEESMEFMVHHMHAPLLKVGSAELTNLPHLQKMASYRLPLIISTGMGTLKEVKEAVRAIKKVWPNPHLAILQCTTAYPTAPEDVNLRVLTTYQREFPKYLIGFSDHTEGVRAPALAVALGAKIIEKHFTIDRTLPGPDHQASLDVKDFSRMVKDIRMTETMLGSAEKVPMCVELANKKVVERFLVAARDIEQGEKIIPNMIIAKRTSEAGGLSVSERSVIVAHKAKRQIQKDHVIKKTDVKI